MTAAAVPTHSRQVVFSGVGTIDLDQAPVPEPSEEDVLLKVARVGICATDLHLLAGHIGDPFPLVPGHEFIGEVAALGAEAAAARGLQVGDHIAVEMLLPCHQCPRCREGRYNLCIRDDMSRGLDRGRQYGVNIPRTIAPGLWGGYADYVYVPQEAITHRLPADLPWDVAALVEPLAVSQRALARGRVAPGDTVAIIGPGPVGILAAAAAHAAGAATVALIGTRQSRLDVARRFGADVTINLREENVTERIQEIFGGGPDVVIEAAGVASAQEQAIQLVRRGGRVVLSGACGAGVPITVHQDEDVLLKELDILPSFLSAGGFEAAIAMLARGAFPYADLITHTFALEDVAAAFAVIEDRSGNVLKAVLDPSRTQ